MRLMKVSGSAVLAVLPLAAALLFVLSIRMSRSGFLHRDTTFQSDLPAVVEQIRDLNRLETASFHAEKIVEARSTIDPLPAWVAGDRVLLVAHGIVTAGIDLSQLGPGDIKSEGGVVHVRLPACSILQVRLDDRSYVYDHHPGIFSRVDPALESEARLKAEDEIKAAALTSGILTRADRCAETSVAGLLHAAGIARVQFDGPAANTKQ